eukprot:5320868-Alexandrium_andersonii.AAC.1
MRVSAGAVAAKCASADLLSLWLKGAGDLNWRSDVQGGVGCLGLTTSAGNDGLVAVAWCKSWGGRSSSGGGSGD